MGTSLGRLLGTVRGVGGVEGPYASDDVRTIADRVYDRTDQIRLLGIGRRGRLTGSSVDDKPVVALLVDEVGGQLRGNGEIERAVCGEGGDHRSQEPAERVTGVGDGRHGPNLPRVGH